MPNYESIYGVSEVVNILSTDRDTVKKIAFRFSYYLSKNANPNKGIPREFSIDDIVVISYILCYWEENPDIQCIEIGLNRGEHLEEPYCNIKSEITTIFREVCEGDEATKTPMLGEMNGIHTIFELANSFRIAGDYLVDTALKNKDSYELLYPTLYNYRHSMELFLKSILEKEKKTHDLAKLHSWFKEVMTKEFDAIPPKWFNEVIEVLHEFDPKGENFRYGEAPPKQEYVVDLNILKQKMNWVADSFQRIKLELNKK